MCYIDQEEKTISRQDQQIKNAARIEEERYREERLAYDREEAENRRRHLWETTREFPLKLPRMSISQKGDISVEGETYARKSKENIGSTKRKVYRNISYSALYKREQRAEQVETAGRKWNSSRKKIAAQLADLYITRPYEEAYAIVQFWSDNKAQNEDLLGENMEKECIAQFMELDLPSDLRTDQAFAEQSVKMEEIQAKARAFFGLYRRNPAMVDDLPEAQARMVYQKMIDVKAFTNYYQIRKQVMTNAYYRSHYNSEISYRCHESDTNEQKNLTLLLWQMESIQNNRRILDSETVRIQTGQLKGFRENVKASGEENADTANARRVFRMNNADEIRVTRQRMDEEDERLRQGSAHIREGIERLERQEAGSPELAGALKEAFEKQMRYLKEKYGNGLLLLPAQELAEHSKEILEDFADMSQYGKLLNILHIRGMGVFDPGSRQDQELERLYHYYNRWLHAEREARRAFAAGGMSYSDYKRKAVIQAVHTEANDLTWLPLGETVEDLVRVNETEALDVSWGTVLDERNVTFHEVLRAFGQKDLREKGSQIQRELSKDDFQWQMLFAESRNMEPVEAARHFVEKEAQGHVERERQQWRSLVFSVQGVSMPGGGTEDFLEMNRRYREILEREDLQRQYGLTEPEKMNEYREILRETEDIAEALHTAEYYGEKAGELLEEIQAHQRMLSGLREGQPQQYRSDDQGVQEQICRHLKRSMERASDEYAARVSEIRRSSLDPLYQRFLDFQERAGMWNEPDNKRLADSVLEGEISKQPGATIAVDLAGKILQLGDSPLSEMLVGRVLRDGQPQEAFQEEIRLYQKIYHRHQVYDRVLKEAGNAEQPDDSLWQRLCDEGMTQKGSMIYDLSARRGIYRARMEQCLNRINRMLV